jgi:hypothetical protein
VELLIKWFLFGTSFTTFDKIIPSLRIADQIKLPQFHRDILQSLADIEYLYLINPSKAALLYCKTQKGKTPTAQLAIAKLQEYPENVLVEKIIQDLHF